MKENTAIMLEADDIQTNQINSVTSEAGLRELAFTITLDKEADTKLASNVLSKLCRSDYRILEYNGVTQEKYALNNTKIIIFKFWVNDEDYTEVFFDMLKAVENQFSKLKIKGSHTKSLIQAYQKLDTVGQFSRCK